MYFLNFVHQHIRSIEVCRMWTHIRFVQYFSDLNIDFICESHMFVDHLIYNWAFNHIDVFWVFCKCVKWRWSATSLRNTVFYASMSTICLLFSFLENCFCISSKIFCNQWSVRDSSFSQISCVVNIYKVKYQITCTIFCHPFSLTLFSSPMCRRFFRINLFKCLLVWSNH